MFHKCILGSAAILALVAPLAFTSSARAAGLDPGWYFDASHPQLYGGQSKPYGTYPSEKYAWDVWNAFGQSGGWTLVRRPYQVAGPVKSPATGSTQTGKTGSTSGTSSLTVRPTTRTYVLTYYQAFWNQKSRKWEWHRQDSQRSTNLGYLKSQKSWWKGYGRVYDAVIRDAATGLVVQ